MGGRAFIVFYYTMLITTLMAANRMGEVYATNVGSTIYNHEVAGSCPALATVNQEVTTIRVVDSFYLHSKY